MKEENFLIKFFRFWVYLGMKINKFFKKYSVYILMILIISFLIILISYGIYKYNVLFVLKIIFWILCSIISFGIIFMFLLGLFLGEEGLKEE